MRAAAPDAEQGVDWLLAPVDYQRFVADFWDQAPLHIHGRCANYYADCFGLREVDATLSGNSLRSPFIRLVRNGSEVPLEGLSGNGRHAVILEDVFAEYRAGASIVLQFLHEQNERLKDLCRGLAVALSASVQANAYLTPSGERGLAIHYDTHDVFVLQIHGRKNWTLYDRTPLPPFKNERGSRSEFENAEPRQHITLSPGDCLYLPRGWIHKAEGDDIASLHLTIGVHPVRWSQLIEGAVTNLLRRNARFRGALPAGFAASERQQRLALTELGELWSVLQQAIDPAQMLQEAVGAARNDLPPDLDGHLLDLERLTEIDQATRLIVRDIPGLSIEEVGSTIRATFHGKMLECPIALSGALRFAVARDSFTVSELPDALTADDKLLFVRRLVREGLLTFGDRLDGSRADSY